MTHRAPQLTIAASSKPWQQQLKEAIRDLPTLLEYVGIETEPTELANRAAGQFPIRVPLSFANRMEKANPNDPLLRQVLAVEQEMELTPGFSADPLDESSANTVPGLLHKYQGRVLFMPTTACAINCRYCFRRHFPYEDNRPSETALARLLDYLNADDSITEVILSGGDPLLLDDELLRRLVTRLETIPQLKRLRIHSRTAIAIPARLTPELGKLLQDSRLAASLVLHCNHPNEIDSELHTRLTDFRGYGVTLLNQSVLLRGVNDDVATLEQLSNRLFDVGVLPYYLHLLDPVTGAAHFDVSEARATALFQELQTRLPGYLVPRLVREIAKQPNKTLIHPDRT